MSPLLAEFRISRLEAESTYASLLERLAAMENELKAQGLQIPKNSRFAIYRKKLAKLGWAVEGEVIGLDAADLAIVHDAILECEQFAQSIQVLTRCPEIEGWRKLAKKAFGGTVSSRAEKDPSARNAQFELFVASLLRGLGCRTRFAEPDIVIDFSDGDSLGVAVKRAVSVNKLKARVRDGNRQIKSSQFPGMVATQMAFFSREPLLVRSRSEALGRLKMEVDDFVSRNVDRLRNAIDHRRTLGWLAAGSKLAILEESGQLEVVFILSLANFCSKNDPHIWSLGKVRDSLERNALSWFK